MKYVSKILILLLISVSLAFTLIDKSIDESDYVMHTVDLSKQELKLYWKNNEGVNYKSLRNLKEQLEQEHKELVFAMNGGMYKKDLTAQGLFIQDAIIHKAIDRNKDGYGNFYMQPNGVFYITQSGQGVVVATDDFINDGKVKYATQSGPMLVINGAIHPRFMDGSKNLNIRNGVGVLPNGDLLFAMSKKKVNFYDFATLFKQNGCNNALYLDGFVSKTYLPSKKSNQLGGNFGVIIGETKSKN